MNEAELCSTALQGPSFKFMRKLFITSTSIQDDVRHWLKESIGALTAHQHFILCLVTNEVIQNVVRYVYHKETGKDIHISISTNKEGFYIVSIQDYGSPCQPDQFLNVAHQPSENGGMGIAIIKKNTKQFTIIANNEGNLAQFLFDPSSVMPE